MIIYLILTLSLTLTMQKTARAILQRTIVNWHKKRQ